MKIKDKLTFRTGFCWYSKMNLEDWKTLLQICKDEIKENSK